MKPSTILLAAMSAALLASCQDKSKNDVKPQTTQEAHTGNEQPGNTPPECCPACGMG